MDVVSTYANDYAFAEGVYQGTLQPRNPTEADIPNASYKPVNLNQTQLIDSAAFRSSAFAAIIFTATTGGYVPQVGDEFKDKSDKQRYKIISTQPYQAGSGVNCLMREIQ